MFLFQHLSIVEFKYFNVHRISYGVFHTHFAFSCSTFNGSSSIHDFSAIPNACPTPVFFVVMLHVWFEIVSEMGDAVIQTVLGTNLTWPHTQLSFFYKVILVWAPGFHERSLKGTTNQEL